MEQYQLLQEIISKYKNDPSSVYNTWFIGGEERLKAFRSIRRGVLQVIEDIKPLAYVMIKINIKLLVRIRLQTKSQPTSDRYIATG